MQYPTPRFRSTLCLTKRVMQICVMRSRIHSASAGRTYHWSLGLSRPDGCASRSAMRALRLIADRKLELADVAAPPPPGEGEVQIRIKFVALNHLDLWGYRGMAFAKRQLPLIVGAEASGEIASVGKNVTGFKPADKVVMYGAMTCGHCVA